MSNTDTPVKINKFLMTLALLQVVVTFLAPVAAFSLFCWNTAVRFSPAWAIFFGFITTWFFLVDSRKAPTPVIHILTNQGCIPVTTLNPKEAVNS